MQSVLVRTKAALNRGEALFEEISHRLEEIGVGAEPATRARLDALRETLMASREGPTIAADARAEIFARDNVLKLLAAKVKLQPSGHDYFVEGKESLLDAALRAGFHVDYGCSSGNCGACKCRILGARRAGYVSMITSSAPMSRRTAIFSPVRGRPSTTW
jgi:CDP-4-dehydro-6-deoxyglucose reductase